MSTLRKATSRKFKSQLFRLAGAAILSVNLSCSSSAPSPAALAAHENAMLKLEKHADTHVFISPNGPGAVRNRFLLMRKETAGCAVRFTSFHRDRDWRPDSAYNTGGETTYGEYDWYYQGDGSFDFTKANVQSGRGKLYAGAHVTLGHYGSLWGPSGEMRSVICGTFNVFWSYPMFLSFASFVDRILKDDLRIEFAPTRWTTLDQIDFRNPRLLWLRHGPGVVLPRGNQWIPIEELP